MLKYFLLFISISAFSNVIKSDRTANYDIKVSLSPETKTLRGSQTLTWTNKTSKPTSELQFHLNRADNFVATKWIPPNFETLEIYI
jgi:hypothetical protein